MSKINKLRKSNIILALLVIIGLGYSWAEGSGGAPIAEVAPTNMNDGTTSLGQMVHSNEYPYDPDALDNAFTEIMACLGYSDISSNVHIILKEPYSAFPCMPLPNGCGGLFDLDNGNGEPVITVTADLVLLRHEYIHYMLYHSTGDPDSNHVTDNYDKCARY